MQKEPIRAIYPCKTVACDFKVARTSKTGLCTSCNDREYRERKKAAKTVKIPENLARKEGAVFCSASKCPNKLGNSLYRFCSDHMKKVA